MRTSPLFLSSARRCLPVLLMASAFCFPPLVARAEDDPPVKKESQSEPAAAAVVIAKKVLEVKGTRAQMEKTCVAALDLQRKSAPESSKAILDGLEAEMTKPENLDELMDIMAVVMASRFTVAELKDLEAFYRTPLGRRMAEEEGSLAVEGMEAGRKWGEKLGLRVAERLEKAKSLN